MALTQDQIDGLVAAHDVARAADDPTIYWTELAKYYVFGTLALGVVEDNTASGILVNNYAENKFVHDFGGTFTLDERHALNMEIMNSDFRARSDAQWNDITGRNISDYHDAASHQVFPNAPDAPESWVLYDPLRALNDYESWLPSSTEASFLGTDARPWREARALRSGRRTNCSTALRPRSPSPINGFRT